MNNKTCVIYTFHKYNENIDYFIKKCYECNNTTWLFIQNVNDKSEIYIPDDCPHYIHFYDRENAGHDFGGWSFGLSLIDINNFNYFMFVNSSAKGPVTNCKKWVDIYTSKLNNVEVLVGSTINKFGVTTCDPYSDCHVQSYAFCLNKIGLDVIIETKIMTLENLYSDKTKIIQQKEIKMSRDILNAGYNICELDSNTNGVDFRKLTPESINRLNGDIQYNKCFQEKIAVPSVILFVKSTRDIDKHFLASL